MKKIGILLFVVTFFAGTIYSQSGVMFSPKISLDLLGNHEVEVMGKTGDLDVNSAITIGLEVSQKVTDIFISGAGISYLFGREQEVKGSGKFYFVPIYVIGQLQLGHSQDVQPSVVGNFGFNVIYNGDSAYSGEATLSGGIYFAAGLRLDFSNLFIEGLYKSFQGSATLSSVELDVNYKTLSIGAGLLF